MGGPEYAVGRFTLRPHRQLLAEGVPVAIGRKGLQMLSVLAEAQGALVTKDELVAKVWPQAIVEDNAVQVQIAALRKALGADGALLKTVRGLGYRLDGVVPKAKARGQEPASLAEPASIADVERAPPPHVAPPAAAAASRRSSPWPRPGVAAALAMVGTVAFLRFGWSHTPAPASERGPLPANPVAAALFTQARDEWAHRDAASLARSIVQLERVTRLDPGFAPAFADLADAYLLAGEAGSLPDAVAFDGAEHAAAHARSLDPGSAGANRATGFIRYWWRHDRPGAADAFRTALRLDPAAAQTHFWYANALADNGEFAAARRHFDLARLADPGSDQIGADYAWALWSEGRDADARAVLDGIVAQQPGNVEAQDCLSVILLSQGDARGYLRGLQAKARLRREPGLDAQLAALSAAYARGGRSALLRTAAALEMAEQADAPYPDHATAAFYASLAGDRAALLSALAAADRGAEQWGSSGYVRRIRSRWATDGAIVAAIDRRAAPRLEAHG